MNININNVSSKETYTAYTLTRELMEYHNALDIFTMTQSRFCELIRSELLMSFIAYADNEPAGVMNAFYKLTTFTGKKILYIEDLYTREKYRGFGIGGKLLKKAKEIAEENDCEQIELKCAVWNKSSAQFYESHGMKKDKNWDTYVSE